MAAYCPKCNYKLKLTDWRPECPKCGVNVVYYGIEERLREEADAAEYHYAVNKPKYDRLKFSLIGHPLSIVRIAIGLLPIAALLLPMGHMRLSVPFGAYAGNVNLVSVIRFFTDVGFDFNALTAAFGSALLGKAVVCFAVALVSVLLMAVLTLAGFFLLTLSCSPKGFRRNVVIPSLGIVLATVSFVSFCLMVKNLNAALPDLFTGKAAPWAYLAVVAIFAAQIAVNVIYKKKGIEVKYTDVSELLLPYHERPSVKEKEQAKAAAPAGVPADAPADA